VARVSGFLLHGEVSGSVGSLTFHRGPTGMVVSLRGRRRVGRTEAESNVLTWGATFRSWWRSLGVLDRRAWEEAAGSESNGFGLWMKTAVAGAQVGLLPESGPPAGESPEFDEVSSLSVSCVGGVVEVSSGGPVLPANKVVLVKVGVFRGPGTRVSCSGYRILRGLLSGEGPVWDKTLEFEAVRGTPVLGSVLVFRFWPMSVLSRRVGAVREATCVVV